MAAVAYYTSYASPPSPSESEGSYRRGRGRETTPKPLEHFHRTSPSLSPPGLPRRRTSGASSAYASSSTAPTSPSLSSERRLSTSKPSLTAQDFSAHHHLPPPVTDAANGIPTQSVLYLPPLLSPLPPDVRHRHAAKELSDAVLANFETRLPHIDPASLALHEALHHFQPRAHYARVPYDEAFNWDRLLLPYETDREWYCVVFRSLRRPSSESLSLYAADRAAHEEAVKNGGLVMYWYGVPDVVTGENLATCIWQSRRHAINAISGPKHREAMRHAAGAYEKYELERWVLSKRAGELGLRLRKWEGGDVGW